LETVKLFKDSSCSTAISATDLVSDNLAFQPSTDFSCSSSGQPTLPLPYTTMLNVAGACLATPRAMIIQSFYDFHEGACKTLNDAGEPYGTGQKSALPLGLGGCVFNDPTGQFGAATKYKKPTLSGGKLVFQTFETDSSKTVTIDGVDQKNTFRFIKMTSQQCGQVSSYVVTPDATAFDSETSLCSCKATSAAGYADAEACQLLGAQCMDATGTEGDGHCAVAIKLIDQLGQSSGTAVNECGNVANDRTASSAGGAATHSTVAGVFDDEAGTCKCTSSSQCASNTFCFTKYGQQGSVSAPGYCGTFDASINPLFDGGCQEIYRIDDAAPISFGECQSTTDFSIYTLSSSNIVVVSGAAAVVAFASLFA